MATAHFTYFKGRGHGERVRIALAAANIQYTETFLTAPGDMDAIRSKCLFNQCPLLEIDGLALTQSWSIVRYLGAKNGLTPANPARAFRADCCGEQIRDFTVAGDFVGLGWAPDYFTSEPVREAGRAKMQGACSSYLPRFERILEAGFLTSSEPCWAGA
jgi:glutathione S-transferase